MSVESAWDEAVASAGEVLESEHQAYIQQAHVLAQRVVRLEAENARLVERLTLLDPEENFALMSTLGDAVGTLNDAMKRLSSTHRIVLKALAQVKA